MEFVVIEWNSILWVVLVFAKLPNVDILTHRSIVVKRKKINFRQLTRVY